MFTEIIIIISSLLTTQLAWVPRSRLVVAAPIGAAPQLWNSQISDYPRSQAQRSYYQQ